MSVDVRFWKHIVAGDDVVFAKTLPNVFGACREKGMVPKDAPYIPLLGAK